MSQDTRAVNCHQCHRLISRNETACPFCGASRSGGEIADRLRAWIAGRGVTHALIAANVLVYLISLGFSVPDILGLDRGIFWIVGPTFDAAGFLGVLEPDAVLEDGEVWRLVTSVFLHAGVIHILFNLSWLRSIGPVLEEEFGSFRFACVYLGSGLCGSFACLAYDQAALGASGAVFGLIGAGWAHGKRRGGVWGGDVKRQFANWAISGVVYTLIMGGSVSIPGHVGGLVGGAALGWIASPPQRRWTTAHRDSPWIVILGSALLASVPISFTAGVLTGRFAPSRTSIPYMIGGAQNLDRWPLETHDLSGLGAPGWSIDLPRGWRATTLRTGLGWSQLTLDSELGASLGVSLSSSSTDFDPNRDWIAWAIDTPGAPIERLQDPPPGSQQAVVPSPDSHSSRFLHAQPLDSKNVLLVDSYAHDSLDSDAWLVLCRRVGASVRKAP